MDDTAEGREPFPIVIAVPDSDPDQVVVSLGPVRVEGLAYAATILGSEEFIETVKATIADARKQLEAEKLAAKAKLN